VITTDRS